MSGVAVRGGVTELAIGVLPELESHPARNTVHRKVASNIRFIECFIHDMPPFFYPVPQQLGFIYDTKTRQDRKRLPIHIEFPLSD